jgi:hypothetical protein
VRNWTFQLGSIVELYLREWAIAFLGTGVTGKEDIVMQGIPRAETYTKITTGKSDTPNNHGQSSVFVFPS